MNIFMMNKKIIFQLLSLSNFFLNIYIIFIMIFLGYLEIAGTSFVIISLINIFTQGLSGNFRNIYLGSKKIINIKYFLLFRIKISLFGIIFSIILSYLFISKTEFIFHLSLIVLTTSNWILELIIARNEKYNKLNIYHLLNMGLFILFFPIIIFFNYDVITTIFIFTFVFLNLLIFKNYLKNILLIRNKLVSIKNFNFNLSIASTLIKAISNFIWRYSALYFLGSSQSALLFMGFSLGSFYGTLFDVSYGAFFFKNLKKNKVIFINFIYIFYIILISILFLIFYNYNFFSTIEFKLLNRTTILSVMGGYIMLLALQIRQKMFEVEQHRTKCFQADIIISVINAFLIYLLYIIDKNLVCFAYLIGSIYFYTIYRHLLYKSY